MDEEVENLLKAWNLQEYLQIFKLNEITSLSLPLIGENEARDLIHKVGPRTVFLKNLEIYRKSIASTSSQDDSLLQVLDISVTDLLQTDTPRMQNNLTASSQLIILDLNILLSNTLEGKGLLNLNKSIPLENTARQKLVKLIAISILQDNPEQCVRIPTYVAWSREILNLFPQEKQSVYFHTKLVQSTRGLVTRLAGKLPDQIHNLKRKYRESGILPKRRRISEISSSSSPHSDTLRLPDNFEDGIEADFTDSIHWLENSSEPWAIVIKKWEETCKARLDLSKSCLISEYFQKYPALRKTNGYILLENDFAQLYPDIDIFENYPTVKEKIWNLAKKRQNNCKDKYFEELLNYQLASEETCNIVTFLLIPTLLAVTTIRLKNSQKKVWRPSKQEVRDGLITHVKDNSDNAHGNMGFNMHGNQLYVDELEIPQNSFEEPPYKQQCQEDQDISEYLRFQNKNLDDQDFSQLFTAESVPKPATNSAAFCKSSFFNDQDESTNTISCPAPCKNATHLIKIEVYELNKIQNLAPLEQWKKAQRRIKYISSPNDNILKEVQNLTYRVTQKIKTHPKKRFYRQENDSKL